MLENQKKKKRILQENTCIRFGRYIYLNDQKYFLMKLIKTFINISRWIYIWIIIIKNIKLKKNCNA